MEIEREGRGDRAKVWLLDEAEWRYRELLEELRRSQAMLEGLTRALPPGGTEESPRGRRWWPFGPG